MPSHQSKELPQEMQRQMLHLESSTCIPYRGVSLLEKVRDVVGESRIDARCQSGIRVTMNENDWSFHCLKNTVSKQKKNK